MAINDRVRETSTSTGSSNLTLAGAVANHQTFNAAFSTNVKFYYVIVNRDASEWETGIGHLSASTTLVRDQVLKSTNSNNAVNFSAGTKDIFCDAVANRLKPPITTATIAASAATLNLALSNKFKITLTENITISLSNEEVWDSFTLELLQDGTGGRTVTWFTTIKWHNGVTPTLTTTASKSDRFLFFRQSASVYEGYHVGSQL